jgi:diguanylate cyclase (GGDEF)-like protein/PAS domain S-box-containing protein
VARRRLRPARQPVLLAVVLVAVSSLTYFAVPRAGPAGLAIHAAILLSPALAIPLGLTLHRPAHRLGWLLLTAAMVLWGIGNVGTLLVRESNQGLPAYPSWGDAFYLASYPLSVAGLFVFVRRRHRGHGRAGLLDALIVTTTVGLVAWEFLVEPVLHESGSRPLRTAVSVAYPLLDLLLLALVSRLGFGGLRRNRSALLLLAANTALLLADLARGVLVFHGVIPDGTAFDAVWVPYYLLAATAATHPSMRTLAEPVAEPPGARPRYWLLLGMAVLTPLVLDSILEVSGRQDTRNLLVGAVALYGLCAIRLGDLVTELVRSRAAKERAFERERALRESATALSDATTREDVRRAVEAAAARLTDREVTACRVVLAGDRHADPDPPVGAALVVPVPEASGEVSSDRGRLVVSVPPAPCPEATDALHALAAQAQTALERLRLSADLLQQHSERRFRSLVQNASDVIFVLDPDTTVHYATPSVERVLGHPVHALEGMPLRRLVHAEDEEILAGVLVGEDLQEALVLRMGHADGTWRHLEAVAAYVEDEFVQGLILTCRDVSDRTALEEELRFQAFHDALTGLPNRALFADRVGHALERGSRTGRGCAVLFCDLDDFKVVNDSRGHAVGDELLVAVAERLREAVRTGDTPARLGGDEFAVLLEDLGDRDDPEAVVDRVIIRLAQPYVLSCGEVRVDVSAGIAFSRSLSSVDELLRNADTAMYRVKEDGGGGWTEFRPAMRDTVVARARLLDDLRVALEEQQFRLFYQPVVALCESRIVGAEALLRWDHPTRGLVSPREFIALAEETGLIVPLGRWVLEQACTEAAGWPGEPLRVGVNLAARQIAEPGVTEDIVEVLRVTGLDPRQLVIELTETALLREDETILARLRQLDEIGVRLALDDFGTGYSSLAYLRRYPIHILKIAQEFVAPVSDGGVPAGLVRTLLDLARVLGMDAVAEGVEEPEQVRILRELGCRLAQGNLYGRPISGEQFGRVLTKGTQVTALAPSA